MSNFFLPSNILSNEEWEARIKEKLISFGVPFLDKVLSGLLTSDLVLIGAATGRGKSELITTIALNVARQFKHVHLFALEAERYEVHRRIKYKLIAERYYEKGGKETINYQGWRTNQFPFLIEHESFADKIITGLSTLHVYYRDSSFDINTFSKIFDSIKDESQMICIDHLGYFDIHDDNENRAMSDIMKKIKDLGQIHNIPVVAVAHLRKSDKKSKAIVPDIDAFMGSSNLVKIATRVVVLGNGGLYEGKYPITYMKCLKNRLGGERLHVVGRTLFDPTRNAYIGDVQFGYLNHDETEWKPFDKGFEPAWL